MLGIDAVGIGGLVEEERTEAEGEAEDLLPEQDARTRTSPFGSVVPVRVFHGRGRCCRGEIP